MVTSAGSYGYLSSSSIEALVNAAIQRQQQQITRVKTEVSDLTVLKSIFTDLGTKLGALRTTAQQLAGTDSTYTFGSARRVEIGTSGVLTATAASSAAAGTYTVQVTGLAKAHSIGGRQYGQVTEALGLAGTFCVGGKAGATATPAVTDATVTGFGTADVAAGMAQLGSGDYSIEYRQVEGDWQFRLVDANGTPMSVKKADGTEGATTLWQRFSHVAGGTYDSGRGLTVTFDAEPSAAKFVGEAGTPRVSYAAKGAEIVVQATHSLADIKAAVNAATYAPGNGVTASIVDRRLVLTAAESGTARTITGQDAVGSVLQSLDLFDAGGAVMNQLQAAADATMVINGSINVTRGRNSSLTDVIGGLTLNLTSEGTTTVKVSTDLTAAQNKVNEFVRNFNDALGYLRAKTGTTETTPGTASKNATYSRGALAGDSTLNSLKAKLYQAMIGRFEHGSLSDLGISINSSSMTLDVTDAAKLSEALATGLSDTSALLSEVAAAVVGALDPYVGGGGSSVGMVARRATSVEDQIALKNKCISDMTSVMQRDQQRMREQYYRLQQQYVSSLNRQQEWMLFAGYSGGNTLFG